MKTIEVTLYKFSELSEKVQQKLIEARAKQNHEFLEAREIEEYLKDNLQLDDHQPADSRAPLNSELFQLDKIGFSLGNCQGDGVNITGEFDTECLIDLYSVGRILSSEDMAILKLLKNEITIVIERISSHYAHSNTIGVNSDYLSFDEYTLAESYLNSIGVETVPHEFNADEQRISARANELAESLGEFGLAVVKRACGYLEKLGYEFINDAASEERAKGELEDDQEEKYMAEGRIY